MKDPLWGQQGSTSCKDKVPTFKLTAGDETGPDTEEQRKADARDKALQMRPGKSGETGQVCVIQVGFLEEAVVRGH